MPGLMKFTNTAVNETYIPPLDELLNEGSLGLFHPGSKKLFVPGVPNNGGWMHNLAQYQARKLVGADVPVFGVQSAWGADDGLVERTAKGGLHIIPSRTKDVAGKLWSLTLPPAIVAYLLGPGAGRYTFLGVSLRVTRAGGATATQKIVRVGQSNSQIRVAVSEGASGTSVVGQVAATPNPVVSPGIVTPGLGQVSAIANSSDSPNMSPILTIGGPLSATYLHKAPAYILYGIYLEDLSVSGLSGAQAQAKFAAWHNKQHGPGGVYYDDTWADTRTVA